jgi:hypothetical protein
MLQAAAVRDGVLHVTSTHCDDDVITSLLTVRGVLNALALHGCSTWRRRYPRTRG